MELEAVPAEKLVWLHLSCIFELLRGLDSHSNKNASVEDWRDRVEDVCRENIGGLLSHILGSDGAAVDETLSLKVSRPSRLSDAPAPPLPRMPQEPTSPSTLLARVQNLLSGASSPNEGPWQADMNGDGDITPLHTSDYFHHQVADAEVTEEDGDDGLGFWRTAATPSASAGTGTHSRASSTQWPPSPAWHSHAVSLSASNNIIESGASTPVGYTTCVRGSVERGSLTTDGRKSFAYSRHLDRIRGTQTHTHTYTNSSGVTTPTHAQIGGTNAYTYTYTQPNMNASASVSMNSTLNSTYNSNAQGSMMSSVSTPRGCSSPGPVLRGSIVSGAAKLSTSPMTPGKSTRIAKYTALDNGHRTYMLDTLVRMGQLIERDARDKKVGMTAAQAFAKLQAAPSRPTPGAHADDTPTADLQSELSMLKSRVSAYEKHLSILYTVATTTTHAAASESVVPSTTLRACSSTGDLKSVLINSPLRTAVLAIVEERFAAKCLLLTRKALHGWKLYLRDRRALKRALMPGKLTPQALSVAASTARTDLRSRRMAISLLAVHWKAYKHNTLRRALYKLKYSAEMKKRSEQERIREAGTHVTESVTDSEDVSSIQGPDSGGETFEMVRGRVESDVTAHSYSGSFRDLSVSKEYPRNTPGDEPRKVPEDTPKNVPEEQDYPKSSTEDIPRSSTEDNAVNVPEEEQERFTEERTGCSLYSDVSSDDGCDDRIASESSRRDAKGSPKDSPVVSPTRARLLSKARLVGMFSIKATPGSPRSSPATTDTVDINDGHSSGARSQPRAPPLPHA